MSKATWWTALTALIILFTVVRQATAATNDPALALQKGLFEEEANHDFNAAIRAYQAVIKQFDHDRKLAATAVFRLGECYRKQGNTNDANAQYERAIREFPDQTPLVTLSRSYLGVMESGPAAGPTAGEVRQDLAKAAAPASKEADEVRRIQAMIKDSPDLINARNGSGQTPLHRAAEQGQLVVATFLLNNGAEVDAQDKFGQTPLHVATMNGHKAMMELLLEHKADVQAKRLDSTSPTPLHLAVEQGFRNLVELLLAHKADINAKGSSGGTPLDLAAARGFRVIAEVLIENEADVNALAASISNPSGGTFNGTSLHIAAQRGDPGMAELLLTNKANPNARLDDGQTPLHRAVVRDHESVVKVLLNHGAEVNARAKGGVTPLVYAVGNKSSSMVKTLLAAHADPNIPFEPYDSSLVAGEHTPLYLAVMRGNAEIANLLLKSGASPNAKDAFNQETALILATRIIQGKDAVTVLLEAKADPNIADVLGQTALHFAVGDPVAINALLAAKADVNAKNKQGETPLHWAAGCGMKPASELLIQQGADLNARDTLANTPLHFAVLAGRAELVDFLLSKGADPNLPNQDGKTPLDFAKTELGFAPAAYWVQIGNNTSFLRPNRPVPPSRSPPLPGIPGTQMGSVAANSEMRQEISSRLKAHGALEDLPHLDRIEVSRSAQGYSAPVFYKGTNDWNQLTLLEAIGVEFGLLSGDPGGQGGEYDTKAVWVNSVRLPFPDLAQVRIRHPEADYKSWHERKVDLTPVLNAGDCSQDMALVWGEVIEITEADHPLNERWAGFSNGELTNLVKCLSRQVTVVIKHRPTKLVVGPEVEFYSGPGGPGRSESDSSPRALREPSIHTKVPLWLKPALRHSNLLLASSDLSRINVTRLDPATGQKRAWVLDCSDGKPAPAFWLRDGDVIEVPEKP